MRRCIKGIDGILDALNGCIEYLDSEIYICFAIDKWAESKQLDDKFSMKKAVHAKAIIHRTLGLDRNTLHGWIEKTQGISLNPNEIKMARLRLVKKMISDIEGMK